MHCAVWLKERSRKLLPLLMIIAFSVTGFIANAQQVTLSEKNISFEKILKEVWKQTGYNFVCKEEWAKDIGLLDIDVHNSTVEELINFCLTGKPYSCNISNKMITIFPKPLRISISGRVMDNIGKPLAGVNVTIKGAQLGTATNEEGEFTLSAVDPKAWLTFSYVGFEPLEERVNNRGRILVKMQPENKLMENATVSNGYQRIQQKFLTGSVTSLKMDSIMQPGLNTVDKMLEGRVPGLTYMINSGQPGVSPRLRIRGTSTILGSREPLWVVDGIVRTDPFPVPADRINDLDFVNLLGNSVSGINPHDIDQVDVLKDATAAALYGVRAANGVIVITTKRGKVGRPEFNYNVTSTFTQRPRYTDRGMNLMNSAERVDVSREMIQKQMTFRGGAIEGYEKTIMDYYAGRIDEKTYQEQIAKAETMNTDWFKAVSHDVFAVNHTLSISGGSPSATYRASLGYADEPGVIKGEGNKRYTALLNLRLTERKFKADFNLSVNKGVRSYVPQEVGVMNYAYGTSRSIPLYNEDGSLYYYSTVTSRISRDNNVFNVRGMNVLNEMNRSHNNIETNEYTASLNLNYNIAEGLQFNSTMSYTGGYSENQTSFEEKTNWALQQRIFAWSPYDSVFWKSNDVLPFGGELREETIRRRNYMINGRLDFSRYADGNRKHLLSGALGSEITSNRYSGVAQVRRGYYPERGSSFASIDLNTYTFYAGWLQNNGQAKITEDQQNLLRTFLTVTYVYDGRYVLTGSASSEYSNAFGTRSNERFLPTWALSGRWNMHEDVLKNIPWIDMAALRVSFGLQGNMPPNQTPNTIIERGSMDSYFGAFASKVFAFPNPSLAWEKVSDYNAAVDFSFFKGKLSGSAGYFKKRTTNAFLPKKLSTINGIASYTVNGGTLENEGIELSFHFKPIENLGANGKRGFMWRIDPQLGQVINRLLNQNVNSRNVLLDPNSITYQSYLNGSVPIDGKSVNTFYSYRFKGLDPDYGFPVFYGAEPENAVELTKLYNTMTRDQLFRTVMVESGRREPVIQGGISNSFVYRNWSLNFNVTYSLGNKIRLMQIASGNYGTFRPSAQQNLRKEFVDRWRYPGDELKTNIPALRGSDQLDESKYAWFYKSGTQPLNYFALDYYQMYDFSDLRVVKGDYLKLKYVSIAYDFNRELCKKWNIKGATIQFTGSDLFTVADKALHGQDPSQSGTAPNINLSVRPVYALNINLTF
ncbi:MAG: SusC/RagA family TonB-linked outer membrane protein [Chitinophagaceae bacterium]|nr:SusC/RagA family TonB-linked outer membrane protein [Chitinophagaceae bacterium]